MAWVITQIIPSVVIEQELLILIIFLGQTLDLLPFLWLLLLALAPFFFLQFKKPLTHPLFPHGNSADGALNKRPTGHSPWGMSWRRPRGKEEAKKEEKKGRSEAAKIIFLTPALLSAQLFISSILEAIWPLSGFIDSRDWLNQYCLENVPLKRRISTQGLAHWEQSMRPRVPNSLILCIFMFLSPSCFFFLLLNAFVPLPSWPYFPP
jgi:hypothetical protein